MLYGIWRKWTVKPLPSSVHDQKVTVTAGELVDLYKVVNEQLDIVVRSADFLKIEAHPSSVTGSIGNHAKRVLFDVFRLHQPDVFVDMKLVKGSSNDRHIFAAATNAAGCLNLVPYLLGCRVR